MSDFKARPGTFRPYMEAVNRDATPQPADADGNPGKARQVQELQKQRGLEPSRYAEALKSLRNAGYIEFAGEGFEGVIQQTSSGSQVVQLAHLPVAMNANWLDWAAAAALGGVVSQRIDLS